MAQSISNSNDIIDSRDVIDRIDELVDERGDLESDVESAQEELDAATLEKPDIIHDDLIAAVEAAQEALANWIDENGDELKALEDLASEGEGCGDWKHGETLIREEHFEDYAQQLAEDIGAVKGSESWPLNCIDWEKAARELRYVYSAVDFDGVTYLIRS